MRLLRSLAVILAAVTLLASPPRAAFDLETSAIPGERYELVVLEVEGCIYCAIFRRDVLPAYEQSSRARSVPIRFVDLNQSDIEQLSLAGPVDDVPTVVLLKDSREVGRIAGYVGPENFFHSVNHLFSGAE